MRYIKKYESYNNLDEISDLFIDFEEEGYSVKSVESKIVEGRDDCGNFISDKLDKLRHVYGKKFINYHKDFFSPLLKDAIVVRISKTNYIKDLTDLREILPRKIIDHWKKLDSEISKKIDVIKKRSEFLNLNLYGVMAEWYQLGQATHDDYRNEPYFGYDMFIDCYTFAFYPSEKVLEKFYNPPSEIKEKLHSIVNNLLSKYEGGKPFFDALDNAIKDVYNEDMILALLKGNSNEWIAASGGFGDKVYSLWKKGKFKCKGMVVFNGKMMTDKIGVNNWYPTDFDLSNKDYVYVDDSYFSGGTARKINGFLSEHNSKIKHVSVIYDGSKEKSKLVKSFFRYYK